MILRLETPASAAQLILFPCPEVHHLERLLLEAFVEDVYEGALQLLTCSDGVTGELVGLIFWRSIPGEEMHRWLVHPEYSLASDLATLSIPDQAHGSPASHATSRELVRPQHLPNYDDWTKIELLCTDRRQRGRGIAKLLLASALAHAIVVGDKTSAILQLAGGHDNRPAERLYEKFGFQEPPLGTFGTPKENLRVVWNMTHGLRPLTDDIKHAQTRRLEGTHAQHGS